MTKLAHELNPKAVEDFRNPNRDHTAEVTFIKDIKKSSRLGKIPKKGDKAIDFTLPDERGVSTHLSDLLKEGPVILSFYRGDWCPLCNLQLRALQQSLTEFQKYGATLFGISPQEVKYSQITKENQHIEYHLLSDEGAKIANAYGLMFEMPDALKNVMTGFGLDIGFDINEYEYAEGYGLPIPATFVINSDSVVSYAFVEPDFTKRAAPAEIIATLMEISA